MTIEELVKNKSELISLKKGTIKIADICEISNKEQAHKALSTTYNDDLNSGVIKRDIVANTYYWMDSHNDVHVGNTFKNSISQKSADKIFHLHDHEHKITAKVGKFLDIYEKQVNWNDLGVSKSGQTTVLIGSSNIEKELNEQVFKMYLNNEVDQHSVGMQYVKIGLAVNDEDYKEEKALWDMYYPMLGNPQRADEKGYFWVVSEAKLIEISAVLMGSNPLTPTIENIDAVKDTSTPDPSTDSQEQAKKQFFINLLK